MTNPSNQHEKIPNDKLTLIMGILSIVFVFCCNPVGLVFGIVGFFNGKKGIELYDNEYDRYLESSYSNVKLGRTLAIIGIVLNVLALIYLATIWPEILEQIQEAMENMEEME